MILERDWDAEAQLCGISYAQQHCLWILHVHDGLTLDELANIAIWNKSTTSALVSRLEKKGLVKKRRVEHSKAIKIYLTHDGSELIEKSVNTEECLDYMSLFREFSEEEVIQVLNTYKMIFEKISKGKNEDFERFIHEYSKNLLE